MRNHIKSFTIFISFFSILCFPNAVFAQTVSSNCWITKVGNPGDQPPTLPPGCQTPSSGGGPTGRCGTVAEWATKIADSLANDGGGGYLSGGEYDNLTQDFKSDCGTSMPRSSWAGQYWCTYLVMDSFNLAGIEGLSVAKEDSWVPTMHKNWGNKPGFFALEYNGGPNKDVIQKVKPGFAIFYDGSGHVGTVRSISIDGHGNGTIETNESNSSKPSHKWPIAEWQVMNGGRINAFGGYE